MKDIYKNLEKHLSSEFYEFLKVFTYRSYQLYGKNYFCDVCLVRERNKKKVFIKLQKRWFGLSKAMKAIGETKPRWIVIKSYNFPQKFEFERARKVFDEISKGDIKGTDQADIDVGIAAAVEEIGRLKKEVEKLEKRKRLDKKAKKRLIMLRQKVQFLDEENKVIRRKMLKSQIPRFRKIIKSAFKDLNKEGEAHFQKLFEGNKWIFGPSYEEVIPKRKADLKNQPDFVLKRYDGFSDIVEIESPTKPLFTKPDKSGKSRPTALLVQSVAQVMDYIDSYNQEFRNLFYEDVRNGVATPIHAYYPRGFVIIGSDQNTDRKKLRQLNNFLHSIAVLTYDEFLKQAERMLEMLAC